MLMVGWIMCKNLTLGNTVSGSLKTGDYHGITEAGGSAKYWHIYRFAMPEDGLLNVYLESASSTYLTYSSNIKADGFAIFSAANPDNIIWRSRYGENEIHKDFSSLRAVYYGTTEISLNQGEYYFAIRRYRTNDTPYFLTLSYKEPIKSAVSSYHKQAIPIMAK